MNREMAEVIEAESGRHPALGHGFTYGGHPLGCAVGCAALDIYARRDIFGHVRALTPGFQKRIQSYADHPLVGEARGKGLLGALELSPNKETAAMFAQPGKVGPRLAAELVKHGVILRAIGDTLAFCPPMIITEEELDELFAPIGTALDATLDWARAEGHMA
jgi:4-aminobutyrate--pyruvate transaminase